MGSNSNELWTIVFDCEGINQNWQRMLLNLISKFNISDIVTRGIDYWYSWNKCLFCLEGKYFLSYVMKFFKYSKTSDISTTWQTLWYCSFPFVLYNLNLYWIISYMYRIIFICIILCWYELHTFSFASCIVF